MKKQPSLPNKLYVAYILEKDSDHWTPIESDNDVNELVKITIELLNIDSDTYNRYYMRQLPDYTYEFKDTVKIVSFDLNNAVELQPEEDDTWDTYETLKQCGIKLF